MRSCYPALFIKFLIVLLAAGVLPGCAIIEHKSTLPTLKIGLAAPFEGLHRPLGYEALFGVKLALQERNSGQGVEGYRVELVALNDFDDPAEAQVQARTLIADPDVVGVVGHLSSAATLAAAPIYREAELALSIPWVVDAALFTAQKKGIVSVSADQAETSARLDAFGRTVGLTNIMTLEELPVGPMPDKIQAIELATDAVTAGEILLHLKDAGLSLPLLGQSSVGSPQLSQVAGTAANGLLFVSPGPDPRHVPEAGAFVQAYQDLAGFPPGPRAVLAYDATQVLLDAIAQAVIAGHKPTRADVSRAITGIQRQGISGPLAFDKQGRRVQPPVWIYRIVEDKYPGVLVASERD